MNDRVLHLLRMYVTGHGQSLIARTDRDTHMHEQTGQWQERMRLIQRFSATAHYEAPRGLVYAQVNEWAGAR